ncbi:MAG: NapC/NirT family cytochrome c [Proteobacteria bacterium]|nr:NapC/NirT family cytochrome c [Pseudomonadota bacterium]
MVESRLKKWLSSLLRPSPSRSILALVALGLVIGVVGVIAFEASLHASSTEKFCIGCHEMQANPYVQLQKTSHFDNVTGVRPTCSDCHVPREFIPKMIRKIEAAREVWGNITGIIDTPEKYAAHAPAMKRREIARMQANDSQECRNCHDTKRWMASLQSDKAQQYHAAKRLNGKTCIDCHTGIAHPENSEGLNIGMN